MHEHSLEETPMKYTLEVYDIEKPGSSDCLAVYDSDSPFMNISRGDEIVAVVSGEPLTPHALTVEKITHIVWVSPDGSQNCKAMVCVDVTSWRKSVDKRPL
jgi:hypothetical protein